MAGLAFLAASSGWSQAPKAPAVIDIFDALQKSLNAIKKPAAAATPSHAHAARKRARKAG